MKLLKLCSPCLLGQDPLESHTIKRIRLPRIAGGLMSRRRTSDRRWLSWRNTWQLLPVWLRQLECEQWKTLGSSEQPRMRRED